MNIRQLLDDRITAALHALGAPAAVSAIVKPSARPEFGDYQANGVMAAAKQLKTNPRELAAKLLEALDLSDLAEKVEIAGPGFINIHLQDAWLAEMLGRNPSPALPLSGEGARSDADSFSSPDKGRLGGVSSFTIVV
ncbi:hypothetical protein VSS37_00245, partial [Candidatus Thiothrix sp. Deng01]|nr:hypothetical protein [Candidatus Thiothrix sp. Deng01]